MRKLIGGLLGLCLLAALMPVEASARTDARASAQPSGHSRSSAARQAAARPAATRASGRATASRAAAPSRHATAERSSRRGHDTAAVSRGRGRDMVASRGRGRDSYASRGRGRDSYASARGNRSLNSRVAAAVPYGRSYTMPQGRGLRRTAMASCTIRHGRRSCSSATASRSEVMRWTGGLAPAAMSQAACPDGTIATLAVGHNDITRCVPL